MHVYEVRSRKDHRGVDLISDALPFGARCCPACRTQSIMQSTTRSFTVAHMMLWFAFTMNALKSS